MAGADRQQAVVEVQAVDPCQRGWHREDGRPGGELLGDCGFLALPNQDARLEAKPAPRAGRRSFSCTVRVLFRPGVDAARDNGVGGGSDHGRLDFDQTDWCSIMCRVCAPFSLRPAAVDAALVFAGFPQFAFQDLARPVLRQLRN